MTAPSFVAASSGVTGTGATLAVGNVSGLSGGETLLLQVYNKDNTEDPETPAGWSPVTLIGHEVTQARGWLFRRDTQASAGSDGAVTLTFGGASDRKSARIYAFANLVGVDVTAVVMGGYTQGTGTSVTAPSIISGGANAIAAAFLFASVQTTVGDFTGESGGDWTETVSEYSPGGSASLLQLQTSSLTGSTGISGGTATLGSSGAWFCQPVFLVGTHTFGEQSPNPAPAESAAARSAIADGNRDVDATVDVFHDGDFRLEMPDVAGVVALAQRLARLIQTDRGFFPWWPNKGINVSDFLLSRTPTWQIANQLKEEIKADEQVSDAFAKVELSTDGREVRVEISVVSAFGPFVFTMTATEAAAQLIDIRAAA